MSDDTDETTDVLEPVAYLSRSKNRLQILEALTETIPKPGLETPGYEPRELREVTGVSEATVSRILNEFKSEAPAAGLRCHAHHRPFCWPAASASSE